MAIVINIIKKYGTQTENEFNSDYKLDFMITEKDKILFFAISLYGIKLKIQN